VMAGLIRTLKLQPQRLSAQLEPGLLATELADYLVKKGLPFRTAHGLVGQAVRLAEDREQDLTGLSQEDLQLISEQFGPDVTEIFRISTALAQRSVPGGTSTSALQAQLAQARHFLENN
jgi:argininosuccinate lyase